MAIHIGRQVAYLPLNELLGISKGRHLAFLKAYYDESITQGDTVPKFLVLGGCTMSSEGWLLLGRNWSPVLQEFDVKTYRSADCNASRGQYVGWDGNKKDDFRTKLIDAVNRSWRGQYMEICPVFCWTALDIGVFTEISKEYPTVSISPYEYSALKVVQGSACAIKNIELGTESTLGLFFEDGQDVRQHIRDTLRNITKAHSRIVDISFVSKKDHIPLQLADMVAWEAWKSQFEGMRKTLENLISSGTGQEIPIREELIRRDFKSLSEPSA